MAPLLHPGNQQHCPPFGFCSYLVIDTLRRLCEWFFVNKVDFLMTHYIITCIYVVSYFILTYLWLSCDILCFKVFIWLFRSSADSNQWRHIYVYIYSPTSSFLLLVCILFSGEQTHHIHFIISLHFFPTHCALFKIPWCTILRYLCYPLWHTLQMDRASADTNTPQIGSVSIKFLLVMFLWQTIYT